MLHSYTFNLTITFFFVIVLGLSQNDTQSTTTLPQAAVANWATQATNNHINIYTKLPQDKPIVIIPFENNVSTPSFTASKLTHIMI